MPKIKSFEKVALLISPNVQNSVAAASFSFAKYWINIVIAPKNAPSPIPKSTIDETERFLASITMAKMQIKLEIKALISMLKNTKFKFDKKIM